MLAQVDRLSAAAYRTLAMARRRLGDAEEPAEAAEEGLELLGVVGLIDPPRPGRSERWRRLRGPGCAS
ncbi:MAG: hypothetical protein R2731_18925 [Nocardioides sp.]